MKTWQDLYQSALVETDQQKLTDLVLAIEDAMFLRAQEFIDTDADNEERSAMEQAAQGVWARGLLKRIQLSISGCLGPCDIPNVVTISNESGTQWLGGIIEFGQYRALLEWAIASRDAGELLALPNQFREHCLHPFHNSDSGGDLFLFSGNRASS
jgi:hypothetical protein